MTAPCERCQAPFTPGQATQRFCSERCRRGAEASRRHGRRYVIRQPAGYRFRCDDCEREREASGHRGPRRTVCGDCTRKRKLRRAKAAQPPAPVVLCKGCGRSFVRDRLGGTARKWCSNSCRKAWVRSNRGASPYGGIKRAKKRGVAWEKFWPIEILERDGWTCQACSDPTPRELRGTTDPKAPEVDHIIPLGPGPHTRENCQCLCRACNMKKGRS